MEEDFDPRLCVWLSVYSTRNGAQNALNKINQAFLLDLQEKGHPLDNEGCVIPLNGATGLPDYEAPRVSYWDTVHQFSESVFYFSKYHKEVLDEE